VDLVIDHSVQVDYAGVSDACRLNMEKEMERNGERYALLRWAQQAFDNFRVVPPGMGIVHQVNLEHLAPVVDAREIDGELVAFPDTLVGTDSHTTMINGIGVIGFGVGGIEAEAVMLGQPLSLPMPVVVGLKLTGALPAGATATDLVLTVTELLRNHGVVGKFVEAYGAGLSSLSLADRATIANMSPEFGATGTLFPVDQETLRYMTITGRSDAVIARTEAYTKLQGLFRTDATPDPQYDENVELDLSTIVPSLPGPLPDGNDRECRRDVRNGQRVGRDRGHHQLHQYLEPLGDARCRTARQEGRRAWPHHAPARQDLARTRIPRGHRVSREGRPAGVPGPASLRSGRVWLHDLYRQLRPARRAD
jgi:aconitate hydratase